MTTPFSPDEQPLDLGAVSRDEDLVEALRSGDADDVLLSDPALAALGALLDDVSQDLPEPAVLPVRETAPVVPAAVLPLRRRRAASRVALVAAVGVGVLSVGGVAAATPDSPLRPVRDALASAVGGTVQEIVAAVTPDAPFDPSGDRPRSATSPSPSPSPSASPSAASSTAASPTSVAASRAASASPRASRPAAAGVRSPQATPGQTVSAESRSRAAANRVSAALSRAEKALDAGRLQAADADLDTAERALPGVSAADGRARLQSEYDALRARLDAATSASPSPEATKASRSPRPEKSAADRSPRPSRTPEAEESAEADRDDDVASAAPKATKPVRTPKAATVGGSSDKAAGRS